MKKKIIVSSFVLLYIVFLLTLKWVKPMIYEALKSEIDSVGYSERESFSLSGEYDSIEVHNGIWDIIFEPNDTAETSITTIAPKGVKINAEISDNTLMIREKSVLSEIAYKHLVLNSSLRPSVYIYIPIKAYEKIECEMIYGGVSINPYGSDDGLSFNTFKARSSSGGVKIGAPVLSGVDVKTVNGDLTLNGNFGDVTFESERGEFYLEGAVYGNVKAYTEGGNIKVSSFIEESVDVKTLVGRIELVLRGEYRSVRAETYSADIDISNARADKITAISAMGDINIMGSIGWSSIDVLSSGGNVDLNLIATEKLKVLNLVGSTKIRTVVPMQYDVDGVGGRIEHPESSGEYECYLLYGTGEAKISCDPIGPTLRDFNEHRRRKAE